MLFVRFLRNRKDLLSLIQLFPIGCIRKVKSAEKFATFFCGITQEIRPKKRNLPAQNQRKGFQPSYPAAFLSYHICFSAACQCQEPRSAKHKSFTRFFSKNRGARGWPRKKWNAKRSPKEVSKQRRRTIRWMVLRNAFACPQAACV